MRQFQLSSSLIAIGLLVMSCLMVTPAQAESPSDLCDYYANTFMHSGSFEQTLADVPMSSERRDQFTSFLKTFPATDKKSEHHLGFECTKDKLAISEASQPEVIVDFSKLAANTLIVNGHEISLSRTRDFADLHRAVSDALMPKKKSAMTQFLLPDAQATILERLVTGPHTIGWRVASSASNAVTLVAVRLIQNRAHRQSLRC